MSTKIILFKTHVVNFTNLAMGLVTKNSPDLMFESCTYTLKRGKFLELTRHRWCEQRKAHVLGKFVKSISNEMEFRWLDWNSNAIGYLEESLEEAKKQEQYVLLGTHHDSQLKFLKKHFGEDILTVATNYEENLYPTLLKYMAQYHVYLLNNELIPFSDRDTEIFESMNDSELVEFYTKEFDYLKLLPKKSVNVCDYNIKIDDFFDEALMKQHMNNLGFPFTENGLKFYHSFISGYSTG